MSGTRKLCSNCRALEFDDSETGGIRSARSENNKTTVHLKYPEGYGNEIEQLFEVEDLLPDLPKLSASARAGCAFCELLLHMLNSDIPTEQLLSGSAKISIMTAENVPYTFYRMERTGLTWIYVMVTISKSISSISTWTSSSLPMYTTACGTQMQTDSRKMGRKLMSFRCTSISLLHRSLDADLLRGELISTMYRGQ